MSRYKDRKTVLVVLSLICLMNLTGCGLWQKYTANSQIKKVEEKLEQASQAEAPKYTSEIFNEATTLVNEAKTLVEQKQYTEAIEKANDAEAKAQMAIDQVEPAKARIAKAQKDLQAIIEQTRQTLEKADNSGAAEKAPNIYNNAMNSFNSIVTSEEQQRIQQVQKLADYENLNQQAQDVLNLAQRAYNQTLKDTAVQEAERMADLMDQAEEIPAAQYVSEGYIESVSAYSSFQAQMQNEEYEKALESSQMLEERVGEVITEAKLLRAEDFIQQASEELLAVKSLGGLIYALEQMQAANEALRDAEISLQSEDYDQAYGYAQRSLESLGAARQEVANRAFEMIAEAEEIIATAIEEGAELYTPDMLAEAREAYGESKLAESREDIRAMLDYGAESLDLAQKALLETKRKKAEKAIREALEITSTAIEEGAEVYAQEPLWNVQELLKEAQRRYDAGEYVEVHPLAREARAAAMNVLDALKASAQALTEQVRSDYMAAVVLRAEEYASQEMRRALELVDSIDSMIASNAFLQAHRTAEEALETIAEAKEKTYRTRTRDNQNKAKSLIAEGKQANADVHSSNLFDEAVTSLIESEAAMERKDLPTALEQSERAARAARQAKLAKIAAAELAFAQALSALANSYAPVEIAQGQTPLAQAKLEMQEKNYTRSNELSDQAKSIFQQAEQLTWQRRAQEDLAKLDAKLQTALEKGALEKAQERYSIAVDTQAKAKLQSQEGQYREAHEIAVLGLKQAETTLQHLSATSTQLTNRLRRRAEEIQQLAKDEEGRERLTQFVEFLSSVQRADNAGEYDEVFRLVQEAQVVGENIEDSIEDHNLVKLANSSGSLLLEYQANGVALVVPDQWEHLKDALLEQQSLIGAHDYYDSKQKLTTILEETSALHEQAIQEAQARVENVRTRIVDIQQAGGAQIMPDEYEKVLQSHNNAQNALLTNDFFVISEMLAEAERWTALLEKGTRIIVDENRYKELIRSYILDMNALQDAFHGVLDQPPEMIILAKSTPTIDVYAYLQGNMKATTLSKRAVLTYEKLQNATPPRTMFPVHSLALELFSEFVTMAKLFERFGQYELFEEEIRNKALKQAYKHYENVKKKSARLELLVSTEIETEETVSPYHRLFPKRPSFSLRAERLAQQEQQEQEQENEE